MIYMTENMRTMLAVFADADKPLRMFDAIGLVLPQPDQTGDGHIRRADPDRWVDLVRAVVELWQQGCLQIPATGDGLHNDLFAPSAAGRRIAADRPYRSCPSCGMPQYGRTEAGQAFAQCPDCAGRWPVAAEGRADA